MTRKRLGVAELLLDHGAKILSNKEGWNPVLLACASGCVPALNMFAHHCIDFNKGYTHWKKREGFKLPEKSILYPLTVACEYKQPKAVQFLLNHGVSIDTPQYGKFSIRDVVSLIPDHFDPETRKILQEYTQKTPLVKSAKCPSFLSHIRSAFMR